MEKKYGPWTIVSSETKYKNPWIEVVEDKVIQPDGKPGIYATIAIANGVGLSVLPIDDEGFVYLTREFHYGVGEYTLEVVSGGANKGEPPLEAAKRELKEELGIEAKQWTELGAVEPFTSYARLKAFLFLARGLELGEPHQDGTETIELVKMKLEKAVEMVMKGEITQGQSCTLILKAKLFLENEKKANL